MEQIEIKLPPNGGEDAIDIQNEELEEELRRRIEKKRIERRQRRKRRAIIERCVLIGAGLLVIVLIVCAIFGAINSGIEAEKEKAEKEAQKVQDIKAVLNEAERLAAGYDYDAAIAKVKALPYWEENEELVNAVAGFENTKATMVRFADVNSITHVFFHTLIADTALAFDGDYKEAGYNQYMTTISEFEKMMQEMYNRGYVLVDIHDIAKEVTDENGNTKFVPGDIYLPEGKIPFVMSQDDVSYYNYMTSDGFATKLVIGEDGMPTCEYVKPDGSVVYGDYDLVPVLERFIEKHPDFSYRGARAALAITGYDGVLGYRTCPTGDGYNPEDIEKAKLVAQRLVECGWTFASHTWGHQKYGLISYEKMKTDAQRWNDEVKPILGDVDVLIYANGYDIAGIESYEGEKYEFLKSLGFKYYCNVDSSRTWVQIRDGYVRQGRRNLDGYRMWYSPDRLSDLFEVEDVWDNSRPTPVPPI